MKLAVLDHLQTHIQGRVVGPTPRVPIVTQVKTRPEPTLGTDYCRFTTSAKIYFEQTAPIDAEPEVRQQAVRAIMRQIYNPVVDELLELREMIYDTGIHFERPDILDKVHAMLSVLQGRR